MGVGDALGYPAGVSLTGRRFRRVHISAAGVVEMMTRGASAVDVVANPLPEDATLIGMAVDPDQRGVWVIVHSKTFDDVPHGALIPVHPDPLFERRRAEPE